MLLQCCAHGLVKFRCKNPAVRAWKISRSGTNSHFGWYEHSWRYPFGLVENIWFCRHKTQLKMFDISSKKILTWLIKCEKAVSAIFSSSCSSATIPSTSWCDSEHDMTCFVHILAPWRCLALAVRPASYFSSFSTLANIKHCWSYLLYVGGTMTDIHLLSDGLDDRKDVHLNSTTPVYAKA